MHVLLLRRIVCNRYRQEVDSLKLFGLFESPNPRAAWRIPASSDAILFDRHAIKAHNIAYSDNLFAASTADNAKEVLEAYAIWGDEFPLHLDIPCVCALWDFGKSCFFVSRDPLGEIPIYYACDGNGVAFTDWLPSLLLSRICEPVMDSNALNELISIGPARTPGRTFVAGIHSLKPGCMLVGNACEPVSLVQYYSLHAEQHTDSETHTAEVVRALLEDAMKLYLSKPCALMLSGGLDSTILTALAMKLDGIADTYSIEYENAKDHFTGSAFQPELDSPYVTLAVQSLKCRHRRVILTEDQLAESLEDAMQARGMPGMGDVDSSFLLFSRAISGHASRVISGECGDEVFGGYPWFRTEAPNITFFPWSGSMDLREMILLPKVREKLNPRRYAQERFDEAVSELPTLPEETEHERLLRKIQNLCFMFFMPNLQERAYHMCRAAGLQIFTPYSYRPLVEYAYNIPWSMKFLKGYEKGLLREAARDLLPPDLLYRKKSPYPKTWNPEYMRLVSSQFEAIAQDRTSPLRQFIDFDAVRRFSRCASPAADPWFGQLMTAPQMLAYLIQTDQWMRTYGIELSL